MLPVVPFLPERGFQVDGEKTGSVRLTGAEPPDETVHEAVWLAEPPEFETVITNVWEATVTPDRFTGDAHGV
jgi:hypothetical protein